MQAIYHFKTDILIDKQQVEALPIISSSEAVLLGSRCRYRARERKREEREERDRERGGASCGRRRMKG